MANQHTSGTSPSGRGKTSTQSTDKIYQPQPIKEAVNSAFDKSDAASQVHPDLVAHITEQVINNLRMSGLTASGQPPPSQSDPHVATVASPTSMPSRVYTPDSMEHDESSNVSSGTSDYHGDQIDGYGTKDPLTSRFVDRPATPPPTAFKQEMSQAQPKPVMRGSTNDTTTLEKIWQPLFDGHGRPMQRLGEFLRGLAIHLIEDYDPCQSLVVTPEKMLKFYDEVKLEDEIYPWNSIFGGKMSHSSLSHLYRDLKCQHHFVQLKLDEKPTVPGLTPLGFECWMTHVIRAHPDDEFDRFSKAVLTMPISNADNSKERFPKQLSRRLFPGQADHRVQVDFEDAVLADPVISLLRKPSKTSPRRTAASTAKLAPPPSSAFAPPPITAQMPPPSRVSDSFERARKPYSASSSEDAMEDPPPISIERERKPYSAQPGGGKIPHYDDLRSIKSEPVHIRANTTATGSIPVIDRSDEHSGRRHHSTSSSARGQAQRTKQRSDSSSNWANAHVQSESDVSAGGYGSTAPNLHDSDEDVDLTRKYSRDVRARRYAPDDNSRIHQPTSKAHEDELQRRGSAQSTSNNAYQYPPPPRHG